MTDTTPDLDAVRAREAVATPGPWFAWDRGTGWHIALDELRPRPEALLPEGFRTDIGREEDADFIAHARTDIPNLLADRDALTAEVERLQRHNDTIFSENQTLGYEIGQLTTSLADRDALAAKVEGLRADLNEALEALAAVQGERGALRADLTQARTSRDALAAKVEGLRGGALGEVAAERAAQDSKWGEQNHPDGTDRRRTRLAGAARARCQHLASKGATTWRHILDEELQEALAEEDPKLLRQELIQVAAVAVAWAEAIDRRTTPGATS